MPSGSPSSAPLKPEAAEIARLDIPALITRFGRGVENFDRRVFDLTDSQLDTAFRPEMGVGQWPVRVLLGHVADAELLFVTRLRRIVAEDHPVLPLWDEDTSIDAGMYRGPLPETPSPLTVPPPIGGFVAVVHTLRRWTTEWLAALAPSCWTRTGLHPQKGEQTLRDIANYATWHLENHAWYLNRKVELFLGPAGDQPPARAGGAGV
jgi:hypothetical protein